VGLDQQVQVVIEHRVVDQAEAEAFAAGRERGAERRVFRALAEPRQPARQLHGDVRGEARAERSSARVAHARDLALGLASGTWAGAAALFEGQQSPGLPHSSRTCAPRRHA
jgi:hypothetical protein